MTSHAATVIAGWDNAPPEAIHPLRHTSEDAYWQSGDRQARMLAELIPAGSLVVDYGCGDGRVAYPLHALGYQVIGADSSPTMLDRLKANADKGRYRGHHIPSVLTTGTEPIAFRGPQPDAIYSLAVLIHHHPDDTTAIVTQLANTVRPGGLLVLDWPTSETPTIGEAYNQVTSWHPDDQAALIDRLHLERIHTDAVPWPVLRRP